MTMYDGTQSSVICRCEDISRARLESRTIHLGTGLCCEFLISSLSIISVPSLVLFRQVNSQRPPLSPKSRADNPNVSKQTYCRYSTNSNTGDLFRTQRRVSTYDLKLIRPDIEGCVWMPLATLVDLNGIEEEVIDPVECLSQPFTFQQW